MMQQLRSPKTNTLPPISDTLVHSSAIMSQMPQPPKSIHALAIPTTGGTPARIGFNLQDHVGASYCIRMMSDAHLKEIWCEAHDDITAIWGKAQEKKSSSYRSKAKNSIN